ncbi:MAG: hypothetical protein WCJ19_06045, partial [bacterium]
VNNITIFFYSPPEREDFFMENFTRQQIYECRKFNYKNLENDSRQRLDSLKNLINISTTPELFQSQIMESTVIVAVGSDSRHENFRRSPLEFIVLTNKEFYLILKEKLTKIVTNNIGDIEVKNPNLGLLSEFSSDIKKGSHKSFWPIRLLDGYFLWGNSELFQSSRFRILNEYRTRPEIRKNMIERIKEEIAVTRSGITRRTTQFNREEGIIFYNPKYNSYGLKYGPLRLFQESIQLIQLDTGISDLSPRTIDKMQYLLRNDNEIQEGYLACLDLYSTTACVQNDRNITRHKIDKEELDFICEQALSIARLARIK